MRFTFVSTMDDVLRHALLPSPEPGIADRPPEPELEPGMHDTAMDELPEMADAVAADAAR